MSSSSSPKNQLPWCKVCKDSGEPESVYSTHFVKDNKGKAICPKLLALNCRSCGESGHTVKFCKKNTTTPTKPAEKKALPTTPKEKEKEKVSTNNMYDLLFSDGEEEQEAVEDFPLLSPNKKEIQQDEFPGRRVSKKNQPMSYAEMTSKPSLKKEEKLKQEVIALRIPILPAERKEEKKKNFSWADAYSSSEGEDEEYY